MSVFNDQFIVLFGGIWDVTKELNDLHVYNTGKNEWFGLQSSSGSPLGKTGANRDSPTSPARADQNQSIDSPNRINRSMTKNAARMSVASPTKKSNSKKRN